MASDSIVCPKGFAFKPQSGFDCLSKDGKWYTYQDCSVANRLYHEKKFNFDKIKAGLKTNKKRPPPPPPRRRPPPPPPSSPPKACSATVSITTSPPRHSTRVREIPKTIYTEAQEETSEENKNELVEIERKLTADTENTSKRSAARSWDDYYEDLASYNKKFKNCNVPSNYVDDKSLSRWVFTQRKLNSENKVPTLQKEKLSALGFDWRTFAEKQQQKWTKTYEVLKAFKSDNRNLDIPVTHTIYGWATDQRRAFRENRLDPKREELLTAIAFRLEPLEYLPAKSSTLDDDEESDESEDDDYEEEEDDQKAEKGGNSGPRSIDGRKTLVESRSEGTSNNSKALDAFGRLMPLIVDLKGLVDEACLLECGNFLLQCIRSEKKDSSVATVSDQSDANSRLLYLAFELRTALDESQKSQGVLDCCEMYFAHLVENAIQEMTPEGRSPKRHKFDR